MCNNVLSVPVASEVTIVGYADDITKIIVAINVIKKWQKDLANVVGKAGAVLATRQRKETLHQNGEPHYHASRSVQRVGGPRSTCRLLIAREVSSLASLVTKLHMLPYAKMMR